MALGRKTGGRKAGTPNRKTQEAIDLLHSMECDPIEGMVRIAQDEKNSAELRGKMYAHLAEYAYPKRRAVEMASQTTQQIVVSWGAVQEPEAPLPPREAEASKVDPGTVM